MRFLLGDFSVLAQQEEKLQKLNVHVVLDLRIIDTITIILWKPSEIMERQATLLGKTNRGIQIAKLIQWLRLNFPLQNNQIGCRRENLLPESQFYCRYFSPKLSFISPMQTLPPISAKIASSRIPEYQKSLFDFLPRKQVQERLDVKKF